MQIKNFYALGLLLLPLAAHATPVSVAGGVGSLGLSLDGAYHINQYFSVDAEFNRFDHSGNRSYEGVNYDYGLHLSSFLVMLNWYPFGGAWHLSAGLANNSSSIDATGVPQNGSYTFNGHTYSAAEVGATSAGLSFPKSATYLGMGWGGNGDWGLVFNLGLLHFSSPQFALNVAGAASNPSLAADVQQYQNQVQNRVNSWTWYPQAALEFYIRF